MDSLQIQSFIAQAFVLFLGVGLHEYAHCKFADMAGDPTPGIMGRVTLDLTKHFEAAGTIMMAITIYYGYGIGWGKPAPMDPRKMKNPRWDFFAAVAAGPITNLLQAIVYAGLFRMFSSSLNPEDPTMGTLYLILKAGVAINLGLFIFNLIPFGPLDGHWLIGLLMPEKPRYYWFRFNERVGRFGLFALVIGLQIAQVPLTAGPISYGYHLLTGTYL